MTHRAALAALIGGALSLAAMAQTKNEWTLKPSGKPGFVQLAIERTSDGDRNHWQRGITEKQLEAGNGGAVRFQIVRDAGTLLCDGVAHNGRALGSFTFQANANYAAQLASAGFRMTPKHSAIDYFLMDVSLDFARAVRQYDVSATDADLFALRIHGVDREFMAAIRNAGYEGVSARQLIDLRIHGVSAEFARDVRAPGYRSATAAQLVKLRIHGVDSAFIANMKRDGLALTIDEVVDLRIHGVSTAFVEDTRKMGYRFTAPELRDLRIHGVDMAYLQKLQSHGLRNLDSKKIVQMKVHGID